jgi:FG-GAP repeat
VAVLARVAFPWRALVAGAMVSVVLGLAVSSRLGEGERPVALSAVYAGVTPYKSVSSLPITAQGPISAALGANDRADRLTRSDDGFHAVSTKQHLRARFSRSGVLLRSGATELGLSLRSVGYGRSLRAVAAVTPTVSANRVSYAHAGLSEWYVNGPLGVEQGFTVERAPAGPAAEPLTLSVALTGDVNAVLSRDGRSLLLTHARGPALRYTGLSATDARGRMLHSWLEVHGARVQIKVDARGASYPLRVDPFVQQGEKLTGEGGRFGWSVALSSDGNTALIGEPQENLGTGAAWVFTRAGSTWTQQGGKLTGGGETGGARFGTSVALSSDGNTAVIGGPEDNSSKGAAWVFTRSGSTWAQQGEKLTATSGEIGGGLLGFSASLSADGNTALIGGPGDSGNLGAAWVFTRSGSTWAQQGEKLTAKSGEENGNAEFGWSAALSSEGTAALIGGPFDNSGVGAAWAFTRSGVTWAQQGEKLTAKSGEESGKAEFGMSAAVSGDGGIFLIGGPEDNSRTGAAWVFARSGSIWTQQGSKLLGGEESGSAEFGQNVALATDGSTALIGGTGDNSSVGAGWVFTRSGSTFAQEGTKLTGGGETGSADFGASAALSADGNTALIGGPQDNGARGAVWAFVNPPPTVTTGSTLLFGTTAVLTGTVSAGASSTAHFQYGTTTAYGSSTASQGVGSGGTATTLAAAINDLALATTYHFRIVAENSGGVSVGADQTFTTAPRPIVGCKCQVLQRIRPRVTSVSQSHRTWREGNRRARVSRKLPPVGTTFSFTLNVKAKVSFAFTQPATGRRVGRTCVAKTHTNRRKHSCKRAVTKGSLAVTGHVGRNKVSFQGVISRSRKLKPGSYTLVITATSAAGLTSAPARLSFTIVK